MFSVASSPQVEKSLVEIRPYQAADNERLSALWLDASRISHSFLPEDLLLWQQRLVAEKYLRETETWVAVEGGVPVGFVGLLETFIGGLFIAPERQGAGIGGLLLSHAFTLKGALQLEVYAANTRACDFYRRHGFCGVRRREVDDNGLPFPLILMQKPCLRPDNRHPAARLTPRAKTPAPR